MSLEAKTRIALNRIIDPELHRSVVELGMVRDLEVSNRHCSFTLALPSLTSLRKYATVEEALEAVSRLDGCRSVTINLVGMTPEERERIIGITRRRTAPVEEEPQKGETLSKAKGLPLQVGPPDPGRAN